jgi:hypothetical protein
VGCVPYCNQPLLSLLFCLALKEDPMHSATFLKSSSALILSIVLFGCGDSGKGEFSEQQICKATISKVMGKNPAIVKIDKISGNVINLSYIRQNDGKHWAYRCKLEGSTVIWASDTGRWRTGKYDSNITFSTNKKNLNISEKYSDGSGDDKSYSLQQLGS